MALTKKAIDALTYKECGKNYLLDGPSGISNFRVRVYKSGKKSFVLGYRQPLTGIQKWTTIGHYGVMTLPVARAEAQRFLMAIHRGEDPTGSSDAEYITVKAYAEIHLEDLEKRGMTPRAIKESARRIRNRILPLIGDKLMVNVKRADVAKLHRSILPRRVEANRVVQLLRAMFNQAEKIGHVPEDHPNPCRHVELSKERSRTRYLDHEELEKLEAAIGQEGVTIQAIIQLLLRLGIRKQECLQLKWEDVHLEQVGVEKPHVYVGNTKNGRDLRLPLNEAVQDIFRKIPVIDDSAYVFPSPRLENRPIADIKRQWERIRTAANLPGVTVHDLRRTCGSILIQAGVPRDHVKDILNHSNAEITRIYTQLAPKQTEDALDKGSEILTGLLGEVGGLKIA